MIFEASQSLGTYFSKDEKTFENKKEAKGFQVINSKR